MALRIDSTRSSSRALVRAACDDLAREGARVTFAAVAGRSGVDRSTLYRDPELRALVEQRRGPRADRQGRTGAHGRLADESVWPPPPSLRRRVEAACAQLHGAGERVTFSRVAVQSGVGRKTLYRYPELRAVVERNRLADVAPDLDALLGEVERLRAEVATLRLAVDVQGARQPGPSGSAAQGPTELAAPAAG